MGEVVDLFPEKFDITIEMEGKTIGLKVDGLVSYLEGKSELTKEELQAIVTVFLMQCSDGEFSE